MKPEGSKRHHQKPNLRHDPSGRQFGDIARMPFSFEFLQVCDIFSRMRGRQGFPFHSGGLGVEGVFARLCATVRNRLQKSATACNRPQPVPTLRNRLHEGHVCRASVVSSAKRVTVEGFGPAASFCVAGVALRDI